jgi:methyltransferase family protein
MDAKYFSDNSQTAGENESHIKYAKEAKDLIVEIGVLYGTTTRILVENSTCMVIGIDPLIPDSMEKTLIGDKSKFQDLIDNHGGRFTFYQDYSFNVVKIFNEEYKYPPIDYLFVDGDHQYDSVKQDFEDWYPHVKVGGIISIHDSACNRQGPMYWPGPSRLADELINDDRLEYVETRHTMTVFRKL